MLVRVLFGVVAGRGRPFCELRLFGVVAGSACFRKSVRLICEFRRWCRFCLGCAVLWWLLAASVLRCSQGVVVGAGQGAILGAGPGA